jgi:hypothetical protein
VKIHRIAPDSSPVTENDNIAIPDPDTVAFEVLGLVSGAQARC